MKRITPKQLAENICKELEANGLAGVILVGEIGSKEVYSGYHGNAYNVGVLLGQGVNAIQDDILKLGGYADYLDGFLKGFAIAESSKIESSSKTRQK